MVACAAAALAAGSFMPAAVATGDPENSVESGSASTRAAHNSRCTALQDIDVHNLVINQVIYKGAKDFSALLDARIRVRITCCMLAPKVLPSFR